MSNAQGDWIWFELMTTDPDAAQAFYAGILGWTASPGCVPCWATRRCRRTSPRRSIVMSESPA